jgi:hypothetical protein
MYARALDQAMLCCKVSDIAEASAAHEYRGFVVAYQRGPGEDNSENSTGWPYAAIKLT